MTDDEITKLIAERLFDLEGVGYYGPTKAHGMHEDYVLCKTKDEANALFFEYWKGDPHGVKWDEDRATELKMSCWRKDWGTLGIPDPLEDDDDACKVWELIAQVIPVAIFSPAIGVDLPRWTVCVGSRSKGHEVHDESRRRAICLAALRVVKAQQE